MFGLFCLGYQISTGVGVWGNNIPNGWAWDITNFVFWIGIGHAGTLISAILYLLRQKWRTSINRSAEAMTLFAVMCAAIFPGVHVGRVWMAWYLAPLPNNWAIWPNFRSPLMWDVFAVSTYFTVSVLFWYTGLIPDLATLRDRATTKIKKFLFGVFACGWRGSNRNWRHYEMAYLLLAGLSTPLVLSVHSVVSFDFATSILPTWHTTIFPPYFVAGAILVVYFVCMCVNAGMWFERFIIIVGGLHRDFIPSAWGIFIPTWVDIWTFIGTLGIFTSLFLLFIRFLPMIAMSEVKIVLPEADAHAASPNGHHPVAADGRERT